MESKVGNPPTNLLNKNIHRERAGPCAEKKKSNINGKRNRMPPSQQHCHKQYSWQLKFPCQSPEGI